MGDDLFVYIDKLEFVAFFSAYPLYYFLLNAFTSDLNQPQFRYLHSLPGLAPRVYAIMALLYVGMKLNQINLQVSMGPMTVNYFNYIFYLKCWASVGVLFFFKQFKLKSICTLLHSAPFFILLILEFRSFLFNKISADLMHNEMRLYFIGFMANLFITVLLFLLSFVSIRLRK